MNPLKATPNPLKWLVAAFFLFAAFLAGCNNKDFDAPQTGFIQLDTDGMHGGIPRFRFTLQQEYQIAENGKRIGGKIVGRVQDIHPIPAAYLKYQVNYYSGSGRNAEDLAFQFEGQVPRTVPRHVPPPFEVESDSIVIWQTESFNLSTELFRNMAEENLEFIPIEFSETQFCPNAYTGQIRYMVGPDSIYVSRTFVDSTNCTVLDSLTGDSTHCSVALYDSTFIAGIMVDSVQPITGYVKSDGMTRLLLHGDSRFKAIEGHLHGPDYFFGNIMNAEGEFITSAHARADTLIDCTTDSLNLDLWLEPGNRPDSLRYMEIRLRKRL
ncbi:MAG: hypothetical protein AAF570_07085 [Bacteroidota bacterium]